jgi:hypothetical protein
MCEYMIKWFFLNLTSLIPLSLFFPTFFQKKTIKFGKVRRKIREQPWLFFGSFFFYFLFFYLLLLLLFHLSFLFFFFWSG